MEIYKDNHDISRSINLELSSDRLTIDSYDRGNGFSEERIITVEDIASLKIVMNVEADDDFLLEQLKADYSKVNGIDLFVDFLTDHDG